MEGYNSFLTTFTDANTVDFNISKMEMNSLFQASIKCEASCGNNSVTYVNGIYYPKLAIFCNDQSKTILSQFYSDKNLLQEVVKRDKNSASYAIRTEDVNFIQSRFEIEGDSALKLGKFEVCHGDYSCDYTFETRLGALSLDEVMSARDDFRIAVNSYYFAGNKDKATEAYLFFSKTRKALQVEEMIDRTKEIGNEIFLEFFSFVWANFLPFLLLLIIGGFLSWRFKDAKSEKLESFAKVFTDMQKISYSFHPKDFVILVAAIWVGTTIGFPILGDVHSMNLQVLASENINTIYEHVNSPLVDQLALFGTMQASLWLLLLLTLFTSILWVFAGLYGVKRAALTLGLFSVLLFFGAIYYTFMAIDMGKPFLIALFGLFFLIIPFELVSLWWERHITNKDYFKSENGRLHYPKDGCSQVAENSSKWKKMVICDQDLHKHEICQNCVEKHKPKK